ncbi:hypothetical protein COCON_G00097700 [Conger conger]|uniref:DNA-dependent metalloprotease SPRTN n=1 Tax=Conger conger TaxID=82655 RepID=A0A9Q1DMD7_CONCO|nr:hypothetical protein COCON_G00097700 [Conger conger]
MDEDFLLAVQLQEQFDCEASTSSSDVVDYNVDPVSKKRKVDSSGDVKLVASYYSSFEPERPMSIVDDSWEMLDPSPDVRAMFLQFNDMLFWGKLCGVEVKWSPRMTLCAGVCSYEGRGGLCSIRLSEPLLKLRPRRDLVQTLLHEMIHALLFVTQNNRDRDGHGPEFCKHMDRINNSTGTKITVYHTFHDEVDLYRQHWWRCSGPCQTRKPFFGYVKRAMNRAPSARDPWWAEHQRSCGGTYVKIKEPEDYGKKGKKGAKDTDTKTLSKPQEKSKPSATTGKSVSQDIRNIIPFSGKGFLLGGSSQASSSQKPPDNSQKKLNFSGSPEPLGPPSGQVSAKAINSPGKPGHGSPHRTALPGTMTSTSRGPQSGFPGTRPPSKKSVANIRAFVNINGSPVRISKTTGPLSKPLGNSPDSTNTTQRSVRDLFHTKVLTSPNGAGMTASTSSASKPATGIKGPSYDVSRERALEIGWNWQATGQPGKSGNTQGHGQSGSSGDSKPGQLNPRNSHQPKPAVKAGAALPVSRKRSWDGRSTAHIFDFFRRTISESSPPKGMREGVSQTPPPPVHPPAPVQSTSLTVSCPVCQVSLPESKINEHLDSCLA